MKKLWKNNRFWLVLIFSLSVFLRFWKISSYQHLTYDQSRDYLIIKKILVDRKFTLVGPTVSIAPGFFLPPFYYYSLIPFVKFFNFHIVGPDIYTAVLGSLSVLFFYLLAKDFFGVSSALIITFAFAVNPYLVQTSRHAWNPNTVFLYSILFFLAFERYLLRKQRKWFILAGFSLGWAIGLHLTAIVFLPFFVYLLFLEIKKRSFDKISLFGTLGFFIIFLPLVFFDLKHNFPITKAGLAYLENTKGEDKERSLALRLKEMAVDSYKMPTVLLSGTFQKENMTVRPSNITSFSFVRLLPLRGGGERVKIVLSLILWLTALLCLLVGKEKKTKLLTVFLFSGLLIRLCFTASLFYFYYYLSVFPLIYLVLGLLIEKNKERRLFQGLICFTFLFLTGFSWFTSGLYKDPRPEGYFINACNIIANDSSSENKVAIVGNVSDQSRWEHNGLEYRYFLEAVYKVPLMGVEADDYRKADVLYLIDEGDLTNPLKLGGVEMEAFRPAKIEEAWQVETGQKIYKMTK